MCRRLVLSLGSLRFRVFAFSGPLRLLGCGFRSVTISIGLFLCRYAKRPIGFRLLSLLCLEAILDPFFLAMLLISQLDLFFLLTYARIYCRWPLSLSVLKARKKCSPMLTGFILLCEDRFPIGVAENIVSLAKKGRFVLAEGVPVRFLAVEEFLLRLVVRLADFANLRRCIFLSSGFDPPIPLSIAPPLSPMASFLIFRNKFAFATHEPFNPTDEINQFRSVFRGKG